MRFASGEYVEVHRPLDEYERWVKVAHEPKRPAELLPAHDERGVRRKGYRRDALRARVSRIFFEDRVDPVTPAELVAAQAHGDHDALPAALEGPAQPVGALGSADNPTDRGADAHQA